jgi:hypothetical protein
MSRNDVTRSTGATQSGGVVGEHVDGSIRRPAGVRATCESANANTDPSSPGRTQTAAAGVSPVITQSS